MADTDDPINLPPGTESEDGHLVVVEEEDGTKEWHETELGQHDRWLRQAPDLFEKYQAVLQRLLEIDEASRG